MTHEKRQDLLVAALNAQNGNNYEQADRLATEVLLSIDQSANDHVEDHISEFIRLGSLAILHGRYQSALERLDAAVVLCERIDNKTLMVKAFMNIGIVQRNRSEFSEALAYFEKSQSLAEEIADKAGVANNLSLKGIVNNHLAEYAKALEYFDQALRIHVQLGDKMEEAKLLCNIGNVHIGLSDYEQALRYFSLSLSLAEEIGDKSIAANNHCNIGIVHQKLSEYAESIESFGKSLSIVEELGNKSVEANIHGNVGVVYVYLSEYKMALECFGKALKIDEELGNSLGVARHICNIGSVHNRLCDYSKALEDYGQALSIDEGIGDKAGVAASLQNIGTIHFELLNFKTSLEYFSKALVINEDLGNKAGVAVGLGSIGAVYHKQQQFELALEYFSRSMLLNKELGMKTEAANTSAEIGCLYSNAQWAGRDESKAEEHLLESIRASGELGTKKYEAHQTLADLYEQQGRLPESIVHLKQYHQLKDEVQSEEARKSAAHMEQRRQLAEREKEIAVAKAAADAQMSATSGLLHKVLPESIATRLIKGEKVADYFQNVSILFADIVGFTPIASRMPAKAVLAFLNHIFGEFDRMVTVCGCEKIKTIGDGYLAVAGAPDSCDDHAERIARLAIEMTKDIILPEEIRKTLPKGAQFSLRIGIHTGPCFGGIVGENRFVYDIYSDAVNIAARMESHGEAGKIHVSDDFCFHLQNRMDASGDDLGGLRFEERDEMEIKGKGMMRTYFLEIA